LKKIDRNAFLAKRLGFTLEGFFIIGFENDSIETIKKTIMLAKSLPFIQTSFFILKPLPGSKIFKHWANEKDLNDFNWSSINYFDGKNCVSKLDPKPVKRWH